MFKRIILILTICAALCGFRVAAADKVIDKSMALLEQKLPIAANSFDFIVTGDSQSNQKLLDQRDVFKKMIQEFNILKPSFVVEVGDLILGGGSENIPPQWDLFVDTISKCEPPYFAAPGNHDIGDALAEKYWQDRMGPTHYAFSYGNSRFIILDSEEVNALDRLSDEQVEWFKHELDSSVADNIFVFLHQPYFTYKNEPERSDEAWDKRWKYLADVMKGHPVRAVFCGHLHGYMDFGVRDGVHYVIAAGAAGFGNDPTETGKFNHYLLVQVRGTDVSWAVIKPGAVLPSNVATVERAAEVANIKKKLIHCDEIPAPLGQMVDRDIVVRVTNTSDKPFTSTLSWAIPAGWKVEPMNKDYEAPANGFVDLPFHLASESPLDAHFPVPALKTIYPNVKYGEPVNAEIEIPFTPTAEAAYAGGNGINVDGKLDEWKNSKPIPMTYFEGFKGEDFHLADLSGQARTMWDEKGLHIAFEITDDVHYQPYSGDCLWMNDGIEFGVDKWAWGVDLTKAGPEVFVYHGEGVSAETVNKDVAVAISRENGQTIYEMTIPPNLASPLELKADQSFRFRAETSDRDAPDGPKHSMSLIPGGDDSEGLRIFLRK